jgi:hypothetical protein
MGFSPKHNIQNAAAKLAEQARNAAETGDRWFVSLATDLEGLGAWAKDEAYVVAESFNAALYTTLEVTKKITKPKRGSPNKSAGPEVSTAVEVDQALIPNSFLSESPSPSKPNQLDLLPASRGAAAVSSSVDEDAEGDNSPSHAPGVLPILQALERVVGEHTKFRTKNLDKDSRFWGLIQLLHLLNPPEQQSDAQAEQESSTLEREES